MENFQKHLPLLITLLYFATGDYLSRIGVLERLILQARNTLERNSGHLYRLLEDSINILCDSFWSYYLTAILPKL